MHDIEPWYGWRDYYMAEEDKDSPFYKRDYNEFSFSNRIYDHYIHPQWDFYGSETLYIKILFVDYDNSVALIEMFGEWNDCIENDIMFFKREIIDKMVEKSIFHFILFCDNVLNYHGDDDAYYEEWFDDVKDDEGWICLINTLPHVLEEMKKYKLHHFVNMGKRINEMDWRTKDPNYFKDEIENILFNPRKLIQSF
ncbi:MAG: hypothetical protein WAT79_00965 [Saprospiraceae bacterium]